jgi:hypothetical protein
MRARDKSIHLNANFKPDFHEVYFEPETRLFSVNGFAKQKSKRQIRANLALFVALKLRKSCALLIKIL